MRAVLRPVWGGGRGVGVVAFSELIPRGISRTLPPLPITEAKATVLEACAAASADPDPIRVESLPSVEVANLKLKKGRARRARRAGCEHGCEPIYVPLRPLYLIS